MPRKVMTPEDDAKLIAEARAFTRARKVRERQEKLRAHQLKKLAAVRAGDKPELVKLMKENPLRGKSKRELTGRPRMDTTWGMKISRTYVSDITLDAGVPFCGVEYFEGYHRGQI